MSFSKTVGAKNLQFFVSLYYYYFIPYDQNFKPSDLRRVTTYRRRDRNNYFQTYFSGQSVGFGTYNSIPCVVFPPDGSFRPCRNIIVTRSRVGSSNRHSIITRCGICIHNTCIERETTRQRERGVGEGCRL